ncbi:MAG: murein biosynthesis integral membrane protein MurJ [Candidatus Vogelbacteria bacterium]|nr:murein biosynthesis integral membrane protein MurJ [Candidatus Vogelbacteria bacterium]
MHKEWSGLHEAALLLGLSALASQILALVRDHLLAGRFGAGQTLDIYYAAFRIPDLVYATIASFVSVTVLIPFLIHKIEQHDNLAAKKFMDSVFTVFCLVMIVVSAGLFFLVPYLTKLTAPGFSPEAQKELVAFTRILLFSPFFLGISNLIGSVTQSLRKFFIYALSPLLYNLGIIAGVLFFYPLVGPTGLVWGVALGALLHLLIQLPVLMEHGFFPGLTLAIDWPTVVKVVKISLPRTLTLATSQLSIVVLISLASFMKAGSIAVFNFAYNLQSVPLAIVGVSYSVAAFPQLTKLFARGEKKEYLAEIGNAIRHIAFWSFISAVLFIVLRAQIVRVILGAGRFGWAETRLTAACLAIFAVSVVAQSLCQLFVRAYYATGRTLTPLLINVFSAGVIIASAFGFERLFASSVFFQYFLASLWRVDNLAGTAILVLPLAFSFGLIVNAVLHWVFFERDFAKLPGNTWRGVWQTLSASLLGGGAAYVALNFAQGFLTSRTFWGVFAQGLLGGLAGLFVFILILVLINNEEVREVGRALGTKFWKTKAVAAEQETL